MEFKLKVDVENYEDGTLDNEGTFIVYTPQSGGAKNELLCFTISEDEIDSPSLGWELNINEAIYLRNFIDAFVQEKEIKEVPLVK